MSIQKSVSFIDLRSSIWLSDGSRSKVRPSFRELSHGLFHEFSLCANAGQY
jgi:hypothetical protein